MGWNVTLLSLFPEMFPGPLGHSLAGKALQEGIWGYDTIHIRDFATDKHGTADDKPFGGGIGLVIRPDVLGSAIDAAITKNPGTKLIYPSPRGKVLTQGRAREISQLPHVTFICGRFEGIDQRIIDAYNVEELSIGDYILSGGEMAALVMMDACIRLLPGVIGKKEALDEESFGSDNDFTGLLEYPLYTRPSEWQHRRVPEVLLSGHHGDIKQWRLAQAEQITQQRRPDLWTIYKLRNGAKENDR